MGERTFKMKRKYWLTLPFLSLLCSCTYSSYLMLTGTKKETPKKEEPKKETKKKVAKKESTLESDLEHMRESASASYRSKVYHISLREDGKLQKKKNLK